jgi:hypothetical protein
VKGGRGEGGEKRWQTHEQVIFVERIEHFRLLAVVQAKQAIEGEFQWKSEAAAAVQ